MDSDHEPFNVTFLAGDTCGQFDVPIKESISEDDEAIILLSLSIHLHCQVLLLLVILIKLW